MSSTSLPERMRTVERSDPSPLLEAWALEPLHSRGDLAARHWLVGRRELGLSAVAGRMSIHGTACEHLWLHLRCVAPGSAPADVALHIPAAQLDSTIRAVDADLHVNGHSARVEIRLHHLGTSPSTRSVPQKRYLVFLADLQAEIRPLRRLWRGFHGTELVKLFAHTVWTRSTWSGDGSAAA